MKKIEKRKTKNEVGPRNKNKEKRDRVLTRWAKHPVTKFHKTNKKINKNKKKIEFQLSSYYPFLFRELLEQRGVCVNRNNIIRIPQVNPTQPRSAHEERQHPCCTPIS